MDQRALFFGAFGSRPRPPAERILRPDASGPDGDRLRRLLAARTPAELTDHDLRTVVAGGLWMLAPEAFLYFLPAFLHAALESYRSVSLFASELVGALTPPSRADVEEALDRAAGLGSGPGLPDDVAAPLRRQQLEWFDSGVPSAIFHERFAGLTRAEGAAVLAFLDAFQEAHGEDFPFDELQTAVGRHWARYRAS
jgi:hypothetical protein